MAEKFSIVQYIIDTFDSIADHTSKTRPGMRYIYDSRCNYYKRILAAEKRGEPIVWHGFGTNPELFKAMGLTPLHADNTAGILTGMMHGVEKYIDASQRYIADHVCGIDKLLLGLAMEGSITKPDIILFASSPCDSIVMMYPMVADFYKVPYFAIDMPYWSDDRSIDYVAEQYDEMVAFVERELKVKLDWNKMADIIDKSNKAYELVWEIQELRKAKPCPLPGRYLGFTQAAFDSDLGSDDLLVYLGWMRDVGRERVAKKEGVTPQERIRVIQAFAPLGWDTKLYDWMEREFGAVTVMDCNAWYPKVIIDDLSDRKKVFRGLAWRQMSIPMGHISRGPTRLWDDMIISHCRDYSADAVIYHGHVACKHLWATAKLWKDKVADQLGIPSLLFECDVFDPRTANLETLRPKVEEFIKTLL